MSRLREIAFILIMSLGALTTRAQQESLHVRADRDHILPGERITLTLEADISVKNNHASLPSLPDTFHHLGVLRRSEVSTANGDKLNTLKQEIIVTGFDNGTWTVPALQFTSGKNVIKSDSLRITIDAVKLTDSTYHDIRDIVEAPEKPFDWKKWGAIALTLVIVAALVWNYLRGRKKRPVPKVTAAERAGAYDSAIKALKTLKDEGLAAQGKMDPFFSRLYDILREYLHRKTGDPVMQNTTSELLQNLKPQLPPDKTGPLAEALRMADAVKFAKYPSSTDEADRAWLAIDDTIRTLHSPAKANP